MASTTEQANTLSTLLREGITLHNVQCFGNLYQFDDDRLMILASCALGAITQGQLTRDEFTETIVSLSRNVIHPINKFSYSIKRAIISLNDTYRWSREEIAVWLESQGS